MIFAKGQAENCKKTSEAILKNSHASHLAKLQADNDIKRLAQRTDQEGVYHAYIWKYGRKEKTYRDFKGVYSHIDYLDYVLNDFFKANDRISEYLWQRKKDYQVSFKRLTILIQTLSLDEDPQRDIPDFVEFSVKVLKDFLDKSYRGLRHGHCRTITD